MTESHDAAAIASGYREMHRPRKNARVSSGGSIIGALDLLVGHEPLHLPGGGQAVVEPLATADVVVLQIDRRELGVAPSPRPSRSR